MDAQSRQAALDNISPEDLEKVREHQAKTKGAYPVDDEWLLIAEFCKAYGGWEAYLAVKGDLISTEEMMTLIEANRKLEYSQMFRDAQASFIGAGSAQTKKPSATFKSLVKDIIRLTKADR